MKKIRILCFTVLLSFAFVNLSYAKSHFITPGARAGGYGTAFAAVADDLTAIYYNPAGLAYQKDTQIMASLFYINYPATANEKSLANYGSDKYSTNAAVPFLAFSTKFYCDTVIAAGVYAIGGGGGKLENTPAVIEKVEGQQSFMVYNISLAKQLTDKISLGLGFDAIQMQDKLVAKAPAIDIDVDYNRSAFGFQGNLGIMYKPVEKLSTAFVVRTGTYIGLPTEPNSALSYLEYVNGYTYPLTLDFGVAYDIVDEFTVAAGITRNKYSWNGVRFQDTTQIRIGTEFRATEKLSLHLGFYSDPNIIKDTYRDSYRLTNLDMYNMKYFTAGIEYNFTDALKAGLSLTHSFTNPVTKDGIRYKYEVNLGRFDISYKFL